MKRFTQYIYELSNQGKRRLKDFLFKTEKEALEAGKNLGIKGIHKHSGKFMPGKDHNTFIKQMVDKGLLENVVTKT